MDAAFYILNVLSFVNLIVFGICCKLAGQDTGASFSGLIPAMIAYASIFVSLILTTLAWDQLFKEIRLKRTIWRAIFSIALAMLPLLFFIYFEILAHEMKR